MLEQVFEATIRAGTPNDRKCLANLAKHPEMGANAQLVYIYSLTASSLPIAYPRQQGRTVYIGETTRQTGAGRRFGHHISKSLTEGKSTLINHTLSVYYYSGVELHVRVFKVTDGSPTTEAERVLLRAHLYKFGAYPMGQGTSGGNNTPYEVDRLFTEGREVHEACCLLIEGAL